MFLLLSFLKYYHNDNKKSTGSFAVNVKFFNTNSFDEDPLGLGKIEDKYKLALDLFEVRLMIEPEIAALASENASENEIKNLKRLCDETEQLYRSGHNHISKDIEFHTCIARCSKNQVVETLLPVINTAVYTFANLTHRLLKEETIETHRAIMEAIQKRGSVGARCAMMMHMTYNRQTIVKILEEREQKGINK